MALHLRAASPDLADESMVIDPTGRWMSTWDEQFARLDIDGSEVLSRASSKYTPGERTSCETTTRSVPFTMKTP